MSICFCFSLFEKWLENLYWREPIPSPITLRRFELKIEKIRKVFDAREFARQKKTPNVFFLQVTAIQKNHFQAHTWIASQYSSFKLILGLQVSTQTQI